MDFYKMWILRARLKITSHFRIPSSGHLCPILNRKIFEIDPLLVPLLAGQFRIEQIWPKSEREFCPAQAGLFFTAP